MAKLDVHQMITDKIVAAIEEGGTLPWIRPWATRGGPRNGQSGRRYTGINRIILTIAGALHGSDEWFTFKGAQKLGAKVRKGEKGTVVTYWNLIKSKDEAGKEKTIPLLRHYYVFNRAQLTGLPAEKTPAPREFNPIHEAESFLAGVGASINFGGDGAVYSLMTDQITLPTRESFKDEASFYATAFHEVIHWTGHPSRMGRPMTGRFGTPEYAEEELVAELGAAFLCGEIGINGQTQHPEYIASWLRALKNDKRFIFKASTAATKAVAFLTGDSDGEVESEG
jgi:antirestriction protein ArdC